MTLEEKKEAQDAANDSKMDATEDVPKADAEDDEGEDRRRGEDDDEVETVKKVDIPAGVDREKTCPLLLRVFCKNGGHHSADDFRGERTPDEELQIYTWMDASLKEISTLIKEVNVSARRKGAKLAFSTVYRDKYSMPAAAIQLHLTLLCGSRGMPSFRNLGDIINGEETAAVTSTLQDVRFRIGDYLDVAIFGQKRPLPVGGRLEDAKQGRRHDDRRAERAERFGRREDRPRDVRPPRGDRVDRVERRDRDRGNGRDRDTRDVRDRSARDRDTGREERARPDRSERERPRDSEPPARERRRSPSPRREEPVGMHPERARLIDRR